MKIVYENDHTIDIQQEIAFWVNVHKHASFVSNGVPYDLWYVLGPLIHMMVEWRRACT